MKNSIEIIDNTRSVTLLFSYGQLVALHEEGSHPKVTSTKYSVTTSKHITQWLTKNFYREVKRDVLLQNELDDLAYSLIENNTFKDKDLQFLLSHILWQAIQYKLEKRLAPTSQV